MAELVERFMPVLQNVGRGVIRMLLTATLAFIPMQFTPTAPPQAVYDFIVVGAGSSGSPVAARLSETGAQVLVLEDGPSTPPEAAVPAYSALLANTSAGNNYRSVPQKHAHWGYNDNTINIVSPRVMGGGSAWGLVFVRGGKHDYDHWAYLGNQGWDYASVLPYFKKLETFKGYRFPGAEPFHGYSGPVPVESKEVVSIVGSAFMKAGREIGYKVLDSNAQEQVGMTPTVMITRKGVRIPTSEAYFAPAANRRNLAVYPNARVTKVLFNKQKRAIGVKYIYDGKERTALARKEVILSAGALNTPKLLMLSGVGPKRHLQRMGIPVVAAVEGVGRNLDDHPLLQISWAVKPGTGTHFSDWFNPVNIERYIYNQTGPLVEVSSMDAGSFLNLSGDDPDWADLILESGFMSLAASEGYLVADQMNFNREIFDEALGEIAGKEAFSMLPMLARPKSRGTVTLRSADPADPPVIDNNALEHPDDVKLIVKALRLCFRLANTRAMQLATKPVFPKKMLRTCLQHGPNSDGYWECYARHMLITGFHVSGTAKMAPDSDPMGVVSPRLRVRGVSGLRVVDTSIMPQIVSANPMAAAIMIGERAADLIKQDWGYLTDPLPL